MFDAIARFFSTATATPMADNDPRLAVAVLLVHLAAVDGTVGDEEKIAVRAALMDYYGLEEEAVRRLVHEARRKDAEAVDFYHFTTALAQLDEKQRIDIVRMMWQVVFADQQNHELEDNMVWRIAELIGVSARQRTILRNQMAKGSATKP
ncbi:MAG: TerB family tellurite resistance protein [Devosia sp.]|nr:TerB family tellurite resistance protein [Devosia sp.]